MVHYHDRLWEILGVGKCVKLVECFAERKLEETDYCVKVLLRGFVYAD